MKNSSPSKKGNKKILPFSKKILKNCLLLVPAFEKKIETTIKHFILI